MLAKRLSRLTLPAVASVRDAIAREQATGVLGVGQGPIVYLRRSPNLFLALADMLRTGFDLGAFHLQMRIGRPLLGFRGSWLLVRQDVERLHGGLDVGPAGSVAEDACWSLVQSSKGRQLYWLPGYVTEQSPTGLKDILRQRRRWFCGDWLTLRHAAAPWRCKLSLASNTATWTVSPLAIAALGAAAAVGVPAWWWVQLLGNVGFACILTTYLTGLIANLAEGQQQERRWLYPLLLLATPVFGVIEAAAILYGLVRFDRGFHVIQKPTTLRTGQEPGPILKETA